VQCLGCALGCHFGDDGFLLHANIVALAVPWGLNTIAGLSLAFEHTVSALYMTTTRAIEVRRRTADVQATQTDRKSMRTPYL
jgi:hypothetical protein